MMYSTTSSTINGLLAKEVKRILSIWSCPCLGYGVADALVSIGTTGLDAVEHPVDDLYHLGKVLQ